MKKIKILHTLVRVGSGGVEQRRLSLARHLDPNLFEQRIVCSESFGRLPSDLNDAGCPVHEVGILKHPFDPAPQRRIIDIIKQYKPDIIHGAVFEGVSFAAISGRLTRTPLIIGEETSDPQDRRWKGHILFRALAGMTHHMIAVSPAVQDYLVNKIHIPSNKVTLINNGVAAPPPVTASEIEALRHSIGLSANDFVVGTVGRLVDNHKRISDLIRAIHIAKQSQKDIHLLVVGSGQDENMLRNMASSMHILDRVHFVGFQANPRPYYDLMDVFALASAHEAFGLVLVEAMYSKLPVVATRVGGIPHVVQEGLTGILVEPFQPQSLADALIHLMNNPALRQRMGEHGHTRALSEFSEGRYVREVQELYLKLANKHLPK